MFSCNLFSGKDNKGNFVFPEQSFVNNEKPALALSGGGSRAFIMSLSTIRILTKKDLMKYVSYISTISGSNWIVAPYIFRDIDMGRYRSPSNITNEILNNDISDIDLITKIDIYNELKYLKKNSLPKDSYWNQIVSKSFLKKYDLDDKIITYSNERADYLESITRFKCEIPLEGRPFWLSNSTVQCDNGPVYCTSNVIYSGIQSRIRKNNRFIGGYMIETPFLSSHNPNTRDEEITTDCNKIFTLDKIIGVSSAAFATYIDKKNNKIRNITHGVINPSNNYISLYNIFDYKSNDQQNVPIIDGYSNDNTGILALLSRGCKKIIIMSANMEINGSDYLNSNLLPLFGMWKEYGGEYYDDSISDSSQVFDSSYWEIVKNQIEERKENGGVVYVKIILPVLKNKRNCIEGGYNVELLIYLLYPSINFISKLKPEIILPPNFPNYKTIFQNKDKIASYTLYEANLLFYYCQWCLYETIDELYDMFK